MKSLLSILSLLSLTTPNVACLLSSNNTKLSTVSKNVTSDLPIPNWYHWDLSTGFGYFRYLGWVYAYTNGYRDHEGWPGIYATDVDNSFSYSDYYKWDDSQMTYTGNEGIINIDNTVKSQTLLDSSANFLINHSDEEQTLSTSSYSHQETKGKTITLGTTWGVETSMHMFIEDTKLNVTVSVSGQWSDMRTDTFTAPAQNVKVPAHSKIEVDYDFYQANETATSRAYREYDPNKIVGVSVAMKVDPNGRMYGFFPYMSLSKWVEWIKDHNLDWILKMPDGYLQEKDDGKIYVNAAPVSYEGLGTVLSVDVHEPEPLNE